MYAVIEGIDTAGKSTQLELLKTKLPNAIFTKEPGGTEIGSKLREMALNGEAKSKIAEMFIFLADRAEHIEEVIKTYKNDTIISDRSLISGIAYANTLPIDKLIDLNLIATQNFLPTHTIILKLSTEELKHRLSLKKNDSIELRGIDYLMNIQDRMIETVKKLDLNHIIIDAKDTIENIEKQIEDFLK